MNRRLRYEHTTYPLPNCSLKLYGQLRTGRSEPDQVSIIEDQENYEPVLKKLGGTRCTITARWGSEKFEYTKDIDDEMENGRVEVSFTPNPQTGRITFAFNTQCFKGSPRQTTQSHGNDRPLKLGDFTTAFYGHLPDGSPAFGDRRADLLEDHPSPNIQTVPNYPAVGDQPSAVHDGAVSGPYQTSADGGKPDIRGGEDTQLGGLKRLWSPDDVSEAGVKRQRSSNSGNPARKAGSQDEGDQPSGYLAAIDRI